VLVAPGLRAGAVEVAAAPHRMGQRLARYPHDVQRVDSPCWRAAVLATVRLGHTSHE
jgi:hypothetical protein